MKKTVFTLFLISLSFIGISQSSLEDKLLEVYSAERTTFILEDAQQQKYFNNLVFNSYAIAETEVTNGKKQGYKVLNSVEIQNTDGSTTVLSAKELIETVNNGTFNILKLKVQRDFYKTNIYLLGNTNYTLRINSYQSLTKQQKQ